MRHIFRGAHDISSTSSIYWNVAGIPHRMQLDNHECATPNQHQIPSPRVENQQRICFSSILCTQVKVSTLPWQELNPFGHTCRSPASAMIGWFLRNISPRTGCVSNDIAFFALTAPPPKKRKKKKQKKNRPAIQCFNIVVEVGSYLDSRRRPLSPPKKGPHGHQ